MIVKSQLKAGIILTYLSLFLGNVVGLLYTPFLIRMLGKSQYGLYGLANSIVGYLAVLDFGFGSATVRYTSKYNAENRQDLIERMHGMFFLFYCAIGLFVFICGIILSSNADKFFSTGLIADEIETVKVLIFLSSLNLAVSFPFGIFASIITAYEHFVFIKIIGLIRLLINPLVFIPLLLLGFKSIGLIIAASVLNLLFLLFNCWYCISHLHIKFLFSYFDYNLLKDVIFYSLWIFIGTIVNELRWNSGQVLLGIFATSTAIAYYTVIMLFKSYFEAFAGGVASVFLPRITTLVSKGAGSKELSDQFIKVGRIQYMITSLMLTGFILFGKDFIRIWAGRDYLSVYYPTLAILFPLALIDAQTLGITILQAKNQHAFRSIVYLFIVIFSIVISIPFIRMYNIYACAFSTSIALILGNLFVMNIFYAKKIGLDIKRFWIEIARISIVVLLILGLAFVVLNFINMSRLIILLVCILTYLILYFFCLYFFCFNEYERQLVRKIKYRLGIFKS